MKKEAVADLPLSIPHVETKMEQSNGGSLALSGLDIKEHFNDTEMFTS